MKQKQPIIEVLIVEDDPRVAEVNRRFMEKMDFLQVIGIATTGEEAKIWIEGMKPQLVLLDVYLPDMKGTDLVWYIRQHFKTTDIIMVTAAGEMETIQEALRGGVFDYLVKPILFDRFKESMERYLYYLQMVSATPTFDQQQLDQLLGKIKRKEHSNDSARLPKGIDGMTLEKVVETLKQQEIQGLTAEQVGGMMGASRTTARRYLEYLVSIDRIRADLTYGTVGRPERKYYPQ